METNITMQTLQRLPQYLQYLKALPKDGPANISATIIADALGLKDVLVRKDLSAVSNGGRPKIGYITRDLISDLEQVLGYDDITDAVIVGVGNLGHALLAYEGFAEYGLHIVAGFDVNEALVNTEVRGKLVLPMHKLEDLCKRLKIHLGVIAVPGGEAQKACDALVHSGVLAILNLTPTLLKVPQGVLVQNENVATALAMLSRHLAENLFL